MLFQRKGNQFFSEAACDFFFYRLDSFPSICLNTNTDCDFSVVLNGMLKDGKSYGKL